MRARVRDVMTSDVWAVSETTPFKNIVELLITRKVSGVPVVDIANRVVGIVSEADLLHKEEFRARYPGEAYQPPLQTQLRQRSDEEGTAARKAAAGNAAQLMTAPAITVGQDESVIAAARLMDRHGVKRLPVVDSGGRLAGIISRRDVLRVFTRRDDHIERDLRETLAEWANPEQTQLTVKEGIVTVTGHYDRRSKAAAAVQLLYTAEGVVDVVDNTTWDVDDTTTTPTAPGTT